MFDNLPECTPKQLLSEAFQTIKNEPFPSRF